MREIVKMIVVLSVICGISGFVLASIKNATKDQIVDQVFTFVQGPALEQVLPSHGNNPVAERKSFPLPGGGEATVFPALRDGILVGVGIEAFGKGFGGDLGVMVGFDVTKDALSGINITTSKETPGVGSRVAEPGFTAQFTGHPSKNLDLKSRGGDIDAVSGATFSSIGAMDAVSSAKKTYESLKVSIQEAW